MPSISQHQSASTTKMLLIGDSGAGKTGALASLAVAGYKLRIIDCDNGLDVLKNYLTDPNSQYTKQNPKCAENVEFVTLTEPMKSVGGRIWPKQATVWQNVVKLLVNWEDGETKLGPISGWGTDTILVIDSLSMLSTAALNFHLQMNGALGATRTQNEARRDIGAAQNMLRDLFAMLYDSSVKCNVIVTSHITLVTETGSAPIPGENSATVGYPSAIGRALSPHIPRYFNTVLFVKAEGVGQGTRHKIFSRNQGIVNVKNTAPLKVAPVYPLETGLADYFKAVRGA